MTANKQIIPLDQARPGMLLAENVLVAANETLLPKGTVLDESHLATLQQANVREIAIEPPPGRSASERQALRDATQAEVQSLFRRSGNDPLNQALCKAVLEYRLEKLG